MHNPDSYASYETVFNSIVEQGKEVQIKLNPDIYEAEKQLNQIPIIARKCWLDGEVI